MNDATMEAKDVQISATELGLLIRLTGFWRRTFVRRQNADVVAAYDRLTALGLAREHRSSIGEVDEKSSYDITHEGRQVVTAFGATVVDGVEGVTR